MKRSYLILKSGDLRGYSFLGCSPLLKAASLGAVMIALLSSVSLVAATTFSPTEQQTTIQSQQDLKSSKSTDGSGVLSSNVFLGDSEGRNGSIHFSSDQFCGVDDIVVSSTFDSKKIDSGRTITEGNNEELIASRKFSACQLEGPAIWTVDGRNTMSDVSNFMPSYAFKRGPEGGGAETASVEIGWNAQAHGFRSIAIGNSSKTEKGAEGATAIGLRSVGGGIGAIAIGVMAVAMAGDSIAFGRGAQVRIKEGVALGSYSVANVDKGVAGYDPITGKATTDQDVTWLSNSSAVSIGQRTPAGVQRTRQIINLAAGTEDTDAVNVAQLKALRQWAGDEIAKAGGSWNLSVNGKNSANISSGSTVDFSSTDNLEISKDEKNKVTFDLAKNITVDSIAVAGHTLDKNGLVLTDGPSITVSGIDMASTKITGVADGVADSDAVNRKQLNAVEQLATKGWTLLVEDKSINVGAGDTISLRTGSKNLSLVSDNLGNMTFDLAKSITVDNITVGGHTLDKGGLILKDGLKNGPSMTITGISAGNKKITGVLGGTEGTDAVNLSQLNEVKNELEKNNWIQQDSGTGVITIGAKVGGTEINLANKDDEGRTLSGLKDGAVSDSSKEAVTGKQLYKVDSELTKTTQKVSDVSKTVDGLSTSVSGLSTSMTQVQVDVSAIAKNTSKYLGGGADVLDGTAPTYKVQGKDYQNVGSAFAGVDSSISDIYSKIANVAGDSLIEQEASADGDGRITIGAKVGGTEINLANKDGEERTLSGIKDGILSDNSTEAVTGRQLYATNQQLASYFGGGAEYGANGWVAPKFEVIQFNFSDEAGERKYNTYNNVADAFGGVNKSMESLNNRIDSVENQKAQSGLSWNEEKGAYDASRKDDKGNDSNSRITGVEDGDISKGSSDVVTGNQLWETNNKVDGLKNDVDDLKNKVDDFENSVGQMAEGAVQYDKDEDGKKTNKITLAGGDASAPVVIDNIGDGKVEKGSKEAINGGQLYEKMEIVLDDAKKYTDEKMKDAVSEAKDYTDMKFDSLNYNIEGVKQEARQAAAIGIAAANLRYNETPGKLSIAISSGLWRHQSAFAFGAGYTSEDGNIRSNVSVTTAGKHFGVGGGVHFTLN
ncbi:YadA-like family protein [Bartonella sp. C271]|uniref:YadA-like family protein n=1 Tax=Bartonella sp. C271 TaxID=3070220 RepID=UPI003D816910